MLTTANVTSPGQDLVSTEAVEGTAVTSLLWLPYLVLTLVLLSLLVASFIHFHYKYRDRYAKRSVLARATRHPASDLEMAPSQLRGSVAPHRASIFLPNSVNDISAATMTLNQNGDANPKTRRLKMFYGNKVDVSSIVVNSMYEKRPSVDLLASRSASRASLRSVSESVTDGTETDCKYTILCIN